jgi:predicted amino acid dehydrogenase
MKNLFGVVMKNTFRIAEISFGRSFWDCAYNFDYQGYKFEVQRFGANFSIANMKKMIYLFRNDVDAFAFTSLPPMSKLDDTTYVHRQYLEIMSTPSSVPLCDGGGIREIANINALIKLIENKTIDPKKGIFFPAASLNVEIEEFMRHEYPGSVFLGDAYTILGLPLVIKPFKGLMHISKAVLSLANLRDLQKNANRAQKRLHGVGNTAIAQQLKNCEYVVGSLPFLLMLDKKAEFLKDKKLIISSHHPEMEAEIQKYKPKSIISLIPEELQISPYIGHPVLDAVLRLVSHKTAPLTVEEWEKLLSTKTEIRHLTRKYVLARNESPQVKLSRKIQKVKGKFRTEKEPDFAFVVHALSHKDLIKVPGLNFLKHLPMEWNDSVDRLASKVPAFVYGRVKHIVSEETGKEVNGIIYALTATPKVLKNEKPEIIYQRINKIAYDAASRGCKLMGLGAYTKVVGDSGVTINKNSPIPVTTGNSLSASATLWGLYDVVKKMGLLKLDSESGRVDGIAMVIGATGSIGKVSAKMLSLVMKRLYIVAPRMERLEDLALEIKKISPACEVICITDSNVVASKVDVLVTATSAFDQKIIDVEKLKPGCVVCDCSRPLDFTEEDAQKRPDILIMESGELYLPGPYELTCNLGLPGKTVYACLAETALLSLEGRNESFTLGRDIDWQKVKEIYQIARKHGVKLAEIQGHMGIITDREIELTKELAIQRRKNWTS